MTDKLHKSEVLLIASTLIVMKAENTYRNTNEMHKTMERELSLLEREPSIGKMERPVRCKEN